MSDITSSFYKVINTVDRIVLDKMNELVNVKDFGAKGDGKSDDAPAIQHALVNMRSITRRSCF